MLAYLLSYLFMLHAILLLKKDFQLAQIQRTV